MQMHQNTCLLPYNSCAYIKISSGNLSYVSNNFNIFLCTFFNIKAAFPNSTLNFTIILRLLKDYLLYFTIIKEIMFKLF